MALHWPTFLTRAGSAVVFAAVMLVGLLWNQAAFLALVALISLLCLREYFGLIERIYAEKSLAGLTVVIAALLLATVAIEFFRGAGCLSGYRAVFDYSTGKYVNYNPSLWPAILCSPILLLLVGALRKSGSVESGLRAIGGLFYIALPCALLLVMRAYHPAWPIILILCIWTNDTMAYIVGSLVGRTPFSPISPKKTWEGTAGGAILTVAGAALWAYLSEEFLVLDVTAVALCAAVFGTLGDLFESKLKRLAGVKDSGTLMPGHGGALDRFDSLLVATPFAFCYLYLVHL